MLLYVPGWLLITLLARARGCVVVIRPPPVLPQPSLPSPPVTATPGCSCGTSIVPLERIRIVGGEPATKHQFPWQVTSHLSPLTPEVLIVSPGGADLQTDRPALLWRLSGELHHRPDGRSLRDSPPPLQSRPGGARRDGARR